MQELYRLLQIMSDLRNPDTGCPWDIRQSFESIAPYTVEEAYEVADAIERRDMADLKNELGDLLFQVVFHAQLASEQQLFDFADVVNEINNKLIRRHPHVFADKKMHDEKALYQQWEQHKKAEREDKRIAEGERLQASFLDGIAAALPALRWSEKLQQRAARHGFDWRSIEPVLDKVDEELAELKAEIATAKNQAGDNKESITDELGDVLFASVNLARHLGVNPEQALRDSNRKFIARFEIVEQLLQEEGKVMEECSVDVLEAYWQKAKEVLVRE